MENENLCIDAAQTSKRNRSYFVYALIDPISNSVRYVGCTINIRNRLSTHLRARTRVGDWLVELRAAGSSPVVKVLQTCRSHAHGMRAESLWIARCLDEGHDLLNKSKRPNEFNQKFWEKKIRAARRRDAYAAVKARSA